MRRLSSGFTYALYLDTPLFTRARTPRARNDWGDQKTVGVYLERKEGEQVGRYLGFFENVGYVVWLNERGAWTSGESFKTLVELKERWELKANQSPVA